MNKTVKKFYDTMYAEGREGKKPGGFLGWLFLKLQRFELHRVPAAASLLEKGTKILDLGCGDGGMLALAADHGYKELYGVDISTPVINRAKKTLIKKLGSERNIHIKYADLDSELPFDSEFFDAITALAVMEHVFDPYKTMVEISRVLRKNGILVIEVPNLVWLPRRIGVLFGRLPVTGDEEGWDGGHLHYYTHVALKDLVKSYGYKIEYIGSTGIFPGMRNLWPSLLGGNIMIKARKVRNV